MENTRQGRCLNEGLIMGYYADEKIDQMINRLPAPVENINIRRHYDYWDAQYANEAAWQNIMSVQNIEMTPRSILFTLPDHTQLWIPKTICMWWKKRQIRVHTEHWEKLLEQHQSTIDLLPDLPDDEFDGF